MLIQRIACGRQVKLKQLKYTKVGLNNKIKNLLGMDGIIIDDCKNIQSCDNNICLSIDGETFWASYKDVIEIEVGLNLTYSSLIKNLKIIIPEKQPEHFWYKKCLNIFKDFQKGNTINEIVKNYNIPKEIIPEIYFLFREKT